MESSSLGLGSLSTSNGSPRLIGSASKLDTDALVNAAYEAKRLPAVRLESKISGNEAKLAAYEEMRTLLGDLKGALAGLRNPPGLLGIKDNVFEAKQAYFTSSDVANPGEFLGITVDNSAVTGSYEIEIEQLAAANKLSLSSATSTSQTLADAWNGGAAFSGTIQLGLDGGDTVDLSVDGTMTVSDFKALINAHSATTGVKANVLQMSGSDFRLVMTGQETGKAITFAFTDDAAPPGPNPFSTTELQEAKPAQFVVDGVPVTRLTNQIDDLIPGTTINLYKAQDGAKINVAIEQDLAGIKDRITAFVDAYNAFREFANQHATIGPEGELGDESILFGDRALRGAVQSLGGLLGGAVNGLDVNAKATLRAIGITFDASNQLKIDGAKLDNALLTDLSGIRKIFEFSFTASSERLGVFARTNALSDTSFTVDIVDADNDGVPESATADGVALVIEDATIKGTAGTAYEGLELIWTGTGSTSIDVTATQGLADKAFNYLDEALDTFGGAIATATKNLEGLNAGYETQIARIEERAAAERERLIERFTAMETALSLAESMLNQIKAQMDAWTADT